jgi:ceramide glucosyltransferase
MLISALYAPGQKIQATASVYAEFTSIVSPDAASNLLSIASLVCVLFHSLIRELESYFWIVFEMWNYLPALLCAGLAICGMGFYALCLWSARSFRRAAHLHAAEFTPPVSILKPLRGVDPQMYESFRSHCVQDYPEYEIIFGVSDADDPAVEAVHRLMAEFPQCRIKLLVCPQVLGNNRKVSNLVQMLPHARYGHIIINDSDIYVSPDYLRRIMAPFGRSEVGMVTCPYRGIAAPTLGSKLESIGISTDFIPGVLVARQIEDGIHFALGSTLAVSRVALDAIGGLEPLVDYLADDFELGYRISGAKFQVVLTDVVVETYLPAYTFRGFYEHQMRWARSTRDSRRMGYLGLLLTFGLPWAIFAVVLSAGAWWSWPVLGAALALRIAVATQVGHGVVHDRGLLRHLWLLPLRDLIACWVWFASFASNKVYWRGEVFVLQDRKIRPADVSQRLISPAEPKDDKVSAHS